MTSNDEQDKRFAVTATVTFEVTFEVEADNEDDAHTLAEAYAWRVAGAVDLARNGRDIPDAYPQDFDIDIVAVEEVYGPDEDEDEDEDEDA